MEEWICSLLSELEPEFPTTSPAFFRFGYKTSGRLFKYTLRPVFEEYGLEWKPPPVSILMVFMVVIPVGFVVVILLVMLAMYCAELFGI